MNPDQELEASTTRGSGWPFVLASSLFCAAYPFISLLFSRMHWGVVYGQGGLSNRGGPEHVDAAFYVLGGLGLLKLLSPICALVFGVWGSLSRKSFPCLALSIVAALMLGNALFILE